MTMTVRVRFGDEIRNQPATVEVTSLTLFGERSMGHAALGPRPMLPAGYRLLEHLPDADGVCFMAIQDPRR